MKHTHLIIAAVILLLAGSVQAADILGVGVTLCPTTSGCPATPTPSATPPPPVNNTGVIRANDFLDSMGVGTKLIQGFDSLASTVNAINYLGLRHFRED